MGKPKRLKSVDLRASWARRHKELSDAFAADLGPEMTAADRSVAAHAATIALECEKMQAAQLGGEAIDLEQLVRLTNALGRIRKDLGAKAAAKAEAARGMTFEERMRLDALKPRREFDENDF
jgi:hypothetical protein